MNENPFFSENRKKVLMHTYGINNCEVLTQTELASLLGITATRIQQLDEENIEEAVRLIREADILIVGGTSLGVYPAAGLIDYYRGHKLVLINKSETPYDNRADLLIHDALGEVFSKIG